jgi:GntR family transcriptional regulator
MLFRSNPSSGVPVYLQLIEQVKHAIDVGALRPGDQLPAIRRLAEDLVINPNTVAKAYRDLERDGLIDLRQGAGAFVAERSDDGRIATMKAAQPVLEAALDRLLASGVTPEEIRRLFDAEMSRLGADKPRVRKP